jgi:hypothetical protein
MFGVGIGHNAKRRIEPQLFFQRLAEIITLAAQLVILRFQCRKLRALLLLHLDVIYELMRATKKSISDWRRDAAHACVAPALHIESHAATKCAARLVGWPA